MLARLIGAFMAFAGAWAAPQAFAQEYPSRPITIVVPLAPGGLGDVLARYVAQGLQRSLQTTVVVDNRSGNSSIAGQLVAKANPDGYTLLLMNLSFPINQLKTPPPGFALADFSAVAHLIDVPFIVAVNHSVPVKSFADFVDYAHANPSKLSYASAGVGSAGNLFAEAIKQRAKIEMTHVPYRGSNPSILAAMSGEINVLVEGGLDQLAPLLRAGSLQPLAITSGQRAPAFPELPTVAETYPDLAPMVSWLGLVAPRGVPPAIVARLNREINAIAATPDFADKFLKNGSVLSLGTPQQFQAFIGAESNRISAVVKSTGLKLAD